MTVTWNCHLFDTFRTSIQLFYWLRHLQCSRNPMKNLAVMRKIAMTSKNNNYYQFSRVWETVFSKQPVAMAEDTAQSGSDSVSNACRVGSWHVRELSAVKIDRVPIRFFRKSKADVRLVTWRSPPPPNPRPTKHLRAHPTRYNCRWYFWMFNCRTVSP